jgi:hypothetical protein
MHFILFSNLSVLLLYSVSGAVRLISALVVALDASENTDEEEKQTLKEQFVNALNQVH